MKRESKVSYVISKNQIKVLTHTTDISQLIKSKPFYEMRGGEYLICKHDPLFSISLIRFIYFSAVYVSKTVYHQQHRAEYFIQIVFFFFAFFIFHTSLAGAASFILLFSRLMPAIFCKLISSLKGKLRNFHFVPLRSRAVDLW